MSDVSNALGLAGSLAARESAETRPAASYVPQFDGLRAIAIAIVVFWHTSLRVLNYGSDTVGDASLAALGIPQGEVGVLLFFFLSGIVIYQPYAARRDPLRWSEAWKFYRRRWVRIGPPYLLVMAGCYLVVGVLGFTPENASVYNRTSASPLQTFLASTVWLNGLLFSAPPRLNPPGWSLEVEVQFYVLLPVAASLLSPLGRRRKMAVLAAGVVLSLAARNILFAWAGEWGRYHWTILNYGYLFLLGMLVAAARAGSSVRAASGSLLMDGVFLCGLAALVAVGLWPTPASAGAHAAQDLLGVAGLLMTFAGALSGRIAGAVLSDPRLVLVGIGSYSIYLIHVPLLHFAAGRIKPLLVQSVGSVPLRVLSYVVLIAIVLAVSAAFHVVVERRFMRHQRRTGGVPKAAAAST